MSHGTGGGAGSEGGGGTGGGGGLGGGLGGGGGEGSGEGGGGGEGGAGEGGGGGGNDGGGGDGDGGGGEGEGGGGGGGEGNGGGGGVGGESNGGGVGGGASGGCGVHMPQDSAQSSMTWQARQELDVQGVGVPAHATLGLQCAARLEVPMAAAQLITSTHGDGGTSPHSEKGSDMRLGLRVNKRLWRCGPERCCRPTGP